MSLYNLPLNLNPNMLSCEDVEVICKFMIGRTDFYWEYSKQGVPFMKKEELTSEILAKHILGSTVIGCSPFIDNEHIMFCGFDFDAHRDESDTDEDMRIKTEEAQNDAFKVFNFLHQQGLAVILNSSGSSGRHVRLYCEGAKAEPMRIFCKYVLEKVCGDSEKHEVFPKQDSLVDDRPYGNQMKGLLCVHPKHKKRANIIIGKKMLDIEKSISVMRSALQNKNNPVKISEEDYSRIKNMDKAYVYISSDESQEIKDSKEIPRYCAFFEEVASKRAMPSGGKYGRHPCLDPNMAAYGLTHKETQIAYAHSQGRRSDTAFRNWKKYWPNGEPIFKCKQIIGYLKHHASNKNNAAICGLDKCVNCPRFKEFVRKKYKPKGWKAAIDIEQVAYKYDMWQCPECKNDFKFDVNNGYFECVGCNKKGWLNQFTKMCLEERRGI